MKNVVREFITRLTNVHIFRVLPHGVDPFSDIRRLLPQYPTERIFDVGANVGQSAKQFLNWFPMLQIYCFEPITANFMELQRRFGAFSNVHCFQLALGASRGQGDMLLEKDSSECTLVRDPRNLSEHLGMETETVAIETLHEFCRVRQIERIGFLKVDTEGYELAVLRGAGDMLDRQQIDFVMVEAGMNPDNQKHVPFEELKKYLEGRGYWLFGIYGQKHAVRSGRSHLRRSNPVFVSKRVIEGNR